MNIRFRQSCGCCFKNRGFTLLEVMIAVSIFGFLILYVSQITRMEIRLFNTVSKKNDLDHNTRAAMMHIIDEIRLNPNTGKYKPIPPVKKYYDEGDVSENYKNKGVYYTFYLPADPTTQINRCLINVRPSDDTYIASLTGPVIYLKNTELWYRDLEGNDKIISDQIKSIDLSTEQLNSNNVVVNVDTLLKIEITAVDNSKLVSWLRLY